MTTTLTRPPGSDEYVLMQHPEPDRDPILTPALAVVAAATNPTDARPRPRPTDPTPDLLPAASRPSVRVGITFLPVNMERLRAVSARIGSTRDATIERAVLDYAARVCGGGRILPDVPKPRGPSGKGVIRRAPTAIRISAHASDVLATLTDLYGGNRSAAVERAVVWFTTFLLDGEDLCR